VSRQRVIVHVDLDAFYASVEIRDNPSLAGKPVVVGGHAQRGVVLAASYEARKFGVKSAMPMTWALRACPQLVVVKPRMHHYADVSEQFFSVLHRYSPAVQGLSLDEAFLDLTGAEALQGPPADAVRRLRAEVRQKTGLAASAGIAPVMFAAKIATDVAKPDGQLEIAPDKVMEFLDPLPVGRLFGVGPKTEAILKAARLQTIGDLRRCDPERLRWALGGEGGHLQALARGEDDRHVESDREAKSIGAEETFDRDLEDLETIETYLLAQSERVAARLRHAGLAARGVTLKYKYEDFKLVTRQSTLDATNDGKTIFDAVTTLLHQHRPVKPIRLCGVSAHSFAAPAEKELFARPTDRQDRLNAVLDSVQEKYGRQALMRARLLTLEESESESLKDPRKK
jgi:DNA polymerase-4